MADPQMSIDDFKRFALAQQAMQQPNIPAQNALASTMNGAPPNAGLPSQVQPDPNAPPTATVTQVQQHQGPIKTFLSQFLYGAGQGLVAHAGLETDADKQQRMFNQQQATGAANRAQQLQAAQIQNFQSQAAQRAAQDQQVDTSTLGIPGLSGMVMQKDLPKVLVQHVRNQGAQGVADTRAGAVTTAAQTRADSQEKHDAVTSQVHRDIANGQLGMAGARLKLAQQVAAAKADGSYGAAPADRLRRGDLANNAQDNINSTIEDIQKDPNLFGKLQGRYTDVQQMMGSDDPAIARIGVQMHNAALASNGAHGLRSAQAVKDTETQMLNHFRNSSEATISGLNAMSKSLDTFIEDAQHGKQFVPRGTSNKSPSSAPPAAHSFFSQFGGTVRKP